MTAPWLDLDDYDRHAERYERGPEPTPPVDDHRQVLLLAVVAGHRRASDGATFILDAPDSPPPIWGTGEQIVWAKGEALIVAGPDGVGKTTLAQQVARARCGIGDTTVLGHPIEATGSKVLYIAADRPAQAQRSMGRMFTEADRDQLAERLVVWRGPLPHDLAKAPDFLAVIADHYGADTVVLDSLKDMAMDLSKDETGSRLNQSIQLALAEGVEVLALHHQRKAQSGAGAPRALSDVYGSRWITAGAGSVVMLWGEPGDSIVDLYHLKQPLEDVGPLKVVHDHHAGRSELVDHVDVWTIVQRSYNGITAAMVAIALYGKPDPSRNEIEKARRQLERLVRTGSVHRKDGVRGGQGADRTPTEYYPVTTCFEEAA
ncbi:MAG: AAA family ATPase [Acidimicrobiales bacterium]